MERLHPETTRTLEQMVKLHGADRLIAEIRKIAADARGKGPRLMVQIKHPA